MIKIECSGCRRDMGNRESCFCETCNDKKLSKIQKLEHENDRLLDMVTKLQNQAYKDKKGVPK